MEISCSERKAEGRNIYYLKNIHLVMSHYVQIYFHPFWCSHFHLGNKCIGSIFCVCSNSGENKLARERQFRRELGHMFLKWGFIWIYLYFRDEISYMWLYRGAHNQMARHWLNTLSIITHYVHLVSKVQKLKEAFLRGRQSFESSFLKSAPTRQ